MQVFKVYLKILWRRRTAFLIYTGIFIVLALGMSSFGSSDRDAAFEATKYPVVIFDQDNSEVSGHFVRFLTDNTEVKEYPDNKEVLTDQLFVRNIACVIYVKKGFAEELERGNVQRLVEVTTLPGTVKSQSILNYVNQYISTLHAYQNAGMSLQKAQEKTGDLLKMEAKVSFAGGHNTSGDRSAVYYFMLYLPYVVISCSILGIGCGMILFNRKEVRDRMNISSYPLLKRNFGLWGGSVLIEAAYACLFLVLAAVIYREGAFSMTRALMALNLICFAALALSMSFLIGMLLDKEQALDMASTVIGLALAFLGGIFVPLSVMGEEIKLVSHFVPTYWYVRALEVVERGINKNNSGEFLLGIGIQLGFAVAFLAFGMAVSKMRRKAA